MLAKRSGNSGRYFSVLNRLSENGLSSETCGRLWDLVIPSVARSWATVYRGELGKGDHAKFTALEKKLRDEVIAGATVYTTLEPCTSRNHPKLPCAARLIERKVRRVVIGMHDPNRTVYGGGWARLQEAGIATADFDNDLKDAIKEMNRDFIRHHERTSKEQRTREEGDRPNQPSLGPMPPPREAGVDLPTRTTRDEVMDGFDSSAIRLLGELVDTMRALGKRCSGPDVCLPGNRILRKAVELGAFFGPKYKGLRAELLRLESGDQIGSETLGAVETHDPNQIVWTRVVCELFPDFMCAHSVEKAN